MNKLYLLDTNIIIDALRKYPSAVEYIDSLEGEVSISVVTAVELILGTKNLKEQRNMEDLLADLNVIHIDEKISMLAYVLIIENRLKEGIEFDDAIIAATAIVYGYTFISKDIKHFKKIPRLKLKVPY
ncbi:hypothetical protein CO058_02505 [candidate division WWE3 bacterium CG_4_9_14_0_2_um_filter_35_11]|uniref:Ribonuclease VapC n=1 Tax=candidate division WWE3 bacterium CG_4_9_14_0_2_um_filter_35_11 TaxID=1975077 RepID=A0A2M8ELI8_UNCKA|nr:MAG: hypothetical protein COV25_02765 [candidate division WWE3 bacterium CG10_big_fil_rev_8_21_14_0_10_35_32]PJC23606.1 MAG: hypothetical protein CO058_02505 [candidate division WWE3 bacterium CG_4_9_14_0_2_um_filter_35_11]